MGKLLERNEETGALKFQWLWNTTNNVKGTYKLGWIHKEDDVVMYKDTLTRTQDEQFEAYTESLEPITDEDVIAHGFKLKSDKRLPLPILRLLHDNQTVNWEMAPARQN